MQQYFQNKKLYNEVYTEDITEEPTFSRNEYTDIVFAGYRWDKKAVIEGIKFDNYHVYREWESSTNKIVYLIKHLFSLAFFMEK